jgi:DNA gyrase subunit A
MEEGEKVLSIIKVDEYDDNHFLFFATKSGIVKRTLLSEFALIRQNGKKAISMREDDELLDVKLTDGTALISISSSNGKMVKFNENDVRVMGRSATGVKGIELVEGCKAVGLSTSLEGDKVLVITDKGYGKLSMLEDYRLTSRGTKGVTTLNMTDKTGKIVTTKSVNGDEDVMIITAAGIVIRTSLTEVKVVGRNTQGVKVIRIKDNEVVSSLTVLGKHEDDVVEENLEVPADEVLENENPSDDITPVAPGEELSSNDESEEE